MTGDHCFYYYNYLITGTSFGICITPVRPLPTLYMEKNRMHTQQRQKLTQLHLAAAGGLISCIQMCLVPGFGFASFCLCLKQTRVHRCVQIIDWHNEMEAKC